MPCNRCGGCCKQFFLNHSHEDIMHGNVPDEPELGKIKEMLVFVKYHEKEKMWEYACKHFREQLADGKPGCAIQNHKPKMCSEYPKDNDTPIRTDCGYWVERANKLNP